MGRKYTGTITVNECAKIDIRFLVRHGFIKNGKKSTGVMQWERGGSIGYMADLAGDNKYINLKYTVTARDGQIKPYDYKINIAVHPSNLGKGEVLYLVCPLSGKWCAILYYDNDLWQSRESFSSRIYYSTQLASKNWVNNSRYLQITKQLKELSEMRAAGYYNGNITHRAKRMQKLTAEQERQNNLRFRLEIQPKWLQQRFTS